MIPMEAQLMHEEAQQKKFFGELVFQYRCGKIILVRRNETLIPSDCSKNESASDNEMQIGAHHRNR
jgi:hypothetical protein